MNFNKDYKSIKIYIDSKKVKFNHKFKNYNATSKIILSTNFITYATIKMNFEMF